MKAIHIISIVFTFIVFVFLSATGVHALFVLPELRQYLQDTTLVMVSSYLVCNGVVQIWMMYHKKNKE